MSGQRALVVIDVQRGFEDPALGPRDNPEAEENVAKLIDAWRRRGDRSCSFNTTGRGDRSTAARPASS
jgi:nicotinamidase-related amidase